MYYATLEVDFVGYFREAAQNKGHKNRKKFIIFLTLGNHAKAGNLET